MRAGFVLILLLAATGAARAQSDIDSLRLRDGTMLRGHVAEVKPNQSVTLVLLTGETRVIQWSDVVSSSGPSFPDSTSPPPPDSAAADGAPPGAAPTYVPPPPPPAPESLLASLTHPGPGRVPLNITAETSRALSIGVPTGSATVQGGYGYGYGLDVTMSERVCSAPCTLYVPPGHFDFTTSGSGIISPVGVEVAPRGSNLVMHTPTRGRRIGGVMLLSGGLALVALGAMVIALASTAEHLDANGNFVHDDATPYQAGGGVLIGAGAGLTVGGIVLLATNRSGVAVQQDR